MKKLLLFMGLTAMVATTSFAQEQKDMNKERAEWDNKVKTELNLSADQAQKYEALSKEYGDKIDAVLQDASLSKEAQKERKMELKKEKEAKLAEFLTPEQLTQYRELVDKKKKEKDKTAKKPY